MRKEIKKGIVEIEEKDFRASGYPTMVVRVYPDITSYYSVVAYTPNTDDTTATIILDDILRKYSGAWQRLSEM